MADFVVNFLPLALVFVAIFAFYRRQSSGYSKHVDDVKAINQEIIELNRVNNGTLQEQLKVLNEIKSLLEDRKP